MQPPEATSKKCSGIALIKKRFTPGLIILLPIYTHLIEHTKSEHHQNSYILTWLFSHIIWRWIGGRRGRTQDLIQTNHIPPADKTVTQEANSN